MKRLMQAKKDLEESSAVRSHTEIVRYYSLTVTKQLTAYIS